MFYGERHPCLGSTNARNAALGGRACRTTGWKADACGERGQADGEMLKSPVSDRLALLWYPRYAWSLAENSPV